MRITIALRVLVLVAGPASAQLQLPGFAINQIESVIGEIATRDRSAIYADRFSHCAAIFEITARIRSADRESDAAERFSLLAEYTKLAAAYVLERDFGQNTILEIERRVSAHLARIHATHPAPDVDAARRFEAEYNSCTELVVLHDLVAFVKP